MTSKPPVVNKARVANECKLPRIPTEILAHYMGVKIEPRGLPSRAYGFWKKRFEKLKKKKREEELKTFLPWSLEGYAKKAKKPPKLWYVDEFDAFYDSFQAWKVHPDMDKYEKRQQRWKNKDFNYHSWVLYKPPKYFVRNANLEETDFDKFLENKMKPNRKKLKNNLGSTVKDGYITNHIVVNPYGIKEFVLY